MSGIVLVCNHPEFTDALLDVQRFIQGFGGHSTLQLMYQHYYSCLPTLHYLRRFLNGFWILFVRHLDMM
jgi:hypothetical protein